MYPKKCKPCALQYKNTPSEQITIDEIGNDQELDIPPSLSNSEDSMDSLISKLDEDMIRELRTDFENEAASDFIKKCIATKGFNHPIIQHSWKKFVSRKVGIVKD